MKRLKNITAGQKQIVHYSKNNWNFTGNSNIRAVNKNVLIMSTVVYSPAVVTTVEQVRLPPGTR